MSGEVGELVAIPFPYTNLEASKRRPVVILTPPDRHGDIVVLAVTSVPTDEQAVRIGDEDLADGRLPKVSWVRTDKAFTLSRRIIAKRYGRLAPTTFDRVREAFCHYVGCGNSIVEQALEGGDP